MGCSDRNLLPVSTWGELDLFVASLWLLLSWFCLWGTILRQLYVSQHLSGSSCSHACGSGLALCTWADGDACKVWLWCLALLRLLDSNHCSLVIAVHSVSVNLPRECEASLHLYSHLNFQRGAFSVSLWPCCWNLAISALRRSFSFFSEAISRHRNCFMARSSSCSFKISFSWTRRIFLTSSFSLISTILGKHTLLKDWLSLVLSYSFHFSQFLLKGC